jgi:hypothetical protein
MRGRDQLSVGDLKIKAQLSRTEFAGTVDQLRSQVTDTVTEYRQRVSPDAIKAEVGDYFRTRGELLLDKARENPLQTAAIGVGLAYPLFGIVRSIPAPVLMVGAGLFLLGSSSGQRASRTIGAMAGDMSAAVAAQADSVADNVQEARDKASKSVASARAAVSVGVSNLVQQTSTGGAALSQRIGELGDNLSDAASTSLNDLREKTAEASDTAAEAFRTGAAAANAGVQNMAASVATFGGAAAQTVKQGARDGAQASVEIASRTFQQNPLLIGGIGLAIGAFFASLLPRSDAEDGLMGEANAELKKHANKLAARGLEAAKGVASDVFSDVATQAEREGLTPRGLSAAAEDLGRRARTVAENATTAAFELSSSKATDAA